MVPNKHLFSFKDSRRGKAHNEAKRCGSHVQRDLSPHLISLHRVSGCSNYLPFHQQIPFMMSTRPPRAHLRGVSHALKNTLSGLRRTEKIFWQEGRKTWPEGQKELIGEHFRISWGFAGIPHSFAI